MKYIVWIKEKDENTGKLGPWTPNGDGPMSQNTAERIIREIQKDFHIPVRALPADQTPSSL